MKATIKEVFESDSWIITKIMNGRGEFRVDAKRRFPIADESSFFSKWGSKKYIDRLSQYHFGTNARNLNVQQH